LRDIDLGLGPGFFAGLLTGRLGLQYIGYCLLPGPTLRCRRSNTFLSVRRWCHWSFKVREVEVRMRTVNMRRLRIQNVDSAAGEPLEAWKPSEFSLQT